MAHRLYIGPDFYGNRGYFIRELYPQGPGPLFNKVTRSFCTHHNADMDLYYHTDEEIGRYIKRSDIEHIEISKQIDTRTRDYFLSCLHILEATSDSFDIGGAL